MIMSRLFQNWKSPLFDNVMITFVRCSLADEDLKGAPPKVNIHEDAVYITVILEGPKVELDTLLNGDFARVAVIHDEKVVATMSLATLRLYEGFPAVATYLSMYDAWLRDED